MRPALSNRVVLMAAVLIFGLTVASALAARSTLLLTPSAGPLAVEPGILGGGTDVVDLPIGINLNASFEIAEYSGATPGDVSTIRAFMP